MQSEVHAGTFRHFRVIRSFLLRLITPGWELRGKMDFEEGAKLANVALQSPTTNIPTLRVIGGSFSGTLYKLEREVMIIGRDPGCGVILEPMSVSRKHAAILRRTDDFMLEDIGSTHGTFVNGLRLTQPRLLQDGDMVRIGEVLLTFEIPVDHTIDRRAEDDKEYVVESELAEVLLNRVDVEDTELDTVLEDHLSGEGADPHQHVPSFESTASTDQELGKFATSFSESTSRPDSIREECVRIRELLESNHVKWDNAERHGLIEEILKPDADHRGLLGRGFYRVVVLDAAHGLGPAGLFDDHQFLEAVRAELVHAFGLRLDGTAFHIEDIFQMLKDEKRSLFCFANFQLIPVVHFRTVRGFTQGVHRVLLLIRGSRDIAHEEGLSAQEESSDEAAEGRT
jgi:pSer/pThr/pTyr-binding forkhead associated (FHA) protein